MASLFDITARVQGILIVATTAATARIPPEIRQAQRDLEDAHGFLAMEDEQELVTVEDARSHANYAKAADWIRSRMDARPVRVDGTGAVQEIDWIISWGDRARLYSDDPLDKGAPRHVYERLSDFLLFPYPDALAPGGALFADGNWRVRIPYFKRLATLTSPAQTNWFSENAEEYLVQKAAGRVLAFNRDREESLFALQAARAERDRLIGEDKKRRLAKQRLLRPRAGARGSSFQVRGIR